MSRSYRKPYAYICGVYCSSHKDKTHAARGYRRLANTYTRDHAEDENFLMPHHREATHNDPWGWNRDGGARWQGGRDLHLLTYLGIPADERSSWINDWIADGTWKDDYVIECSRK